LSRSLRDGECSIHIIDTTMSIARLPQLGNKPVALTVKMKVGKAIDDNLLAKGLQELYRKGEFTDVALCCSEKRFLAHSCVLASQSRCFKEGLAAQPLPGPGTRHEIRLEVANPEAVKIMLDYLYMLEESDWATFNPRTQAVNRDVLQLAAQFDLPGLTGQAMYWLSKDLTTGNVVERLSLCEEFGLSELSEKFSSSLLTTRQHSQKWPTVLRSRAIRNSCRRSCSAQLLECLRQRPNSLRVSGVAKLDEVACWSACV